MTESIKGKAMHGVQVVHELRGYVRPTIMSGQVVTIALSFQMESPPYMGKLKSLGPFEVSASREAVVVHRARLTSDPDLASRLFLAAVEHAFRYHTKLKEGHRYEEESRTGRIFQIRTDVVTTDSQKW